MKIFKCNMCGNVLEAINDKCDNVTCCNTEMKELKAFEVEGAKEKHIPVYNLEDNKLMVSVGEVLHPMDEDHYIEFITYESGNNVYRVNLKPGDEPKCSFPYLGEGTLYAYCNKHGLWKSDVK